MSKLCMRQWQAEAVEDGRLSVADSASFERHSETCEFCARERAALRQMRVVALRMPSPTSSPLERRRLHHALLRRAHTLSVGEKSAPPLLRFAKTWPTLAVAALLGVAVLLVFFPKKLPTWKVAEWASEPHFELVATKDAPWHKAKSGAELRLVLGAGSFSISVDKLRPAQSFALELPDGELEVRGTRFIIEVSASDTQRVSVSEGLVALRLRGQKEVLLAAGNSWSQRVVLPATPKGTEASAVQPEVYTPRPPHAHALPTRAASNPRAPDPGPIEAAESSETTTAATKFATAMATFSRGDFATAERLFAGFEAHYPHNPHVEDTLFLRALARHKRGDVTGARELAGLYLRRYPSGFRSREARELAR